MCCAFLWLFLFKVNSEDIIFLREVVVKPDPSVWCFCNRFDFGSTRLVFGRFGSIGLALSESLCIIVDLSIGHACH